MIFKLSDTKSRLLALMGSGILVGTALAIIIPEGVNSIYGISGQQPLGLHQHNKLSTIVKPVMSTTPSSDSLLVVASSKNVPPHQDPTVATWVIGPSLVVGFVLMLLIDQLSFYLADGVVNGQYIEPSSGNPASCSQRDQATYSLASQSDDEDEVIQYDHRDLDSAAGAVINIGSSNNNTETVNNSETRPIISDATTTGNGSRLVLRDIDGRAVIDHNTSVSTRSLNRPKVTPTLGLVIHALADGIALGAAARSSRGQVEMIIFLAIMLHKAPAAFSLVVFLIHMGLKHSTIRRHLLAFSLSAPLAALVTYFGLNQSSKESLQQSNATGVAMLFSAGTFLFVATVHVLPELLQNKSLDRRELMFLVGGAFLPIILAQTI